MENFESFKKTADLWRIELLFGDETTDVAFVYAKNNADAMQMAKGWLEQSLTAEAVILWNVNQNTGFAYSKD